VVLFDEIEKAHPDVFNILLQIMEEGRLTDNVGRRIDFRNTLVIMSSNVGATSIKGKGTLGFAQRSADWDHLQMSKMIMEEVDRTFRPEFLNRLDDIIFFRSLTKEDVSAIIGLEVAAVASRLVRKKITITLADDAKEFLMSVGFDEKFGARPMRRAVEKHIEDALSEKIIKGEIREGMAVTAKKAADGKGLAFDTD
jgi:ATP-dependent Clp protease ATP-binding subunit ClpC